MKSIKFGLGTSGIMGSAITDRGRISLLDHAYQNNITHFDTAPLYGQGDAEKVLGKFISDKRDKITLTTKFGLFPTPYPRYLLPLKPVARYVNRANRHVKDLKALLNKPKPLLNEPVITNTTAPVENDSITPYKTQRITSELEISLSKLKTEYIDYYLLHDCQPNHINDDIVDCLVKLQSSGKIRYFGLGTSRNNANEILKQYPELNSILQLKNSPYAWDKDEFNRQGKLLVTHSLFRDDFHFLDHLLTEYKEQLWRKLSTTLSTQEMITRFLIHRAHIKNPDGILLFSSSNKQRISTNVMLSQDVELNENIEKHILSLIKQVR